MYRAITLCLILLCGHASAHQWTPTYPKLEQSYVPGILRMRMEIFNNRQDINHYEISVFDEDWNPVKFAVADKIVRVGYLQRKTIDVHIRSEDRNVVTYVCSKSKIITNDEKATVVSSRICSKVK